MTFLHIHELLPGQIRVILHVNGAPPGDRLVEAWETNADAALTLVRSDGQKLTLPGPRAAGNDVQDATEPYQWQVPKGFGDFLADWPMTDLSAGSAGRDPATLVWSEAVPALNVGLPIEADLTAHFEMRPRQIPFKSGLSGAATLTGALTLHPDQEPILGELSGAATLTGALTLENPIVRRFIPPYLGLWAEDGAYSVIDREARQICTFDGEGNVSHVVNLHFLNQDPVDLTFFDQRWYVVDSDTRLLFVYRESGSLIRVQGLGFRGPGINPMGITGAAGFVWIVLGSEVFALDVFGARQSGLEFDLDPANTNPIEIGTDGTRIMVADHEDHKAYAYLSTGERDAARDINFGSDVAFPAGIDALPESETWYVYDAIPNRLRAFSPSALANLPTVDPIPWDSVRQLSFSARDADGVDRSQAFRSDEFRSSSLIVGVRRQADDDDGFNLVAFQQVGEVVDGDDGQFLIPVERADALAGYDQGDLSEIAPPLDDEYGVSLVVPLLTSIENWSSGRRSDHFWAQISADLVEEMADVTIDDPWPDAAVEVANRATPGTNVAGDIVTLYRGAFADSRAWNPVDGLWEPFGSFLDGGLVVNGTIAGDALVARSVHADRLRIGGGLLAEEEGDLNIRVDEDSGISIGEDGVTIDATRIQLAAGDASVVVEDGAVRLNAGDVSGLEVDDEEGVRVRTPDGSGLIIGDNGVRVDAGTNGGLVIGPDGLAINVGTGNDVTTVVLNNARAHLDYGTEVDADGIPNEGNTGVADLGEISRNFLDLSSDGTDRRLIGLTWDRSRAMPLHVTFDPSRDLTPAWESSPQAIVGIRRDGGRIYIPGPAHISVEENDTSNPYAWLPPNADEIQAWFEDVREGDLTQFAFTDSVLDARASLVLREGALELNVSPNSGLIVDSTGLRVDQIYADSIRFGSGLERGDDGRLGVAVGAGMVADVQGLRPNVDASPEITTDDDGNLVLRGDSVVINDSVQIRNGIITFSKLAPELLSNVSEGANARLITGEIEPNTMYPDAPYVYLPPVDGSDIVLQRDVETEVVTVSFGFVDRFADEIFGNVPPTTGTWYRTRRRGFGPRSRTGESFSFRVPGALNAQISVQFDARVGVDPESAMSVAERAWVVDTAVGAPTELHMSLNLSRDALPPTTPEGVISQRRLYLFGRLTGVGYISYNPIPPSPFPNRGLSSSSGTISLRSEVEVTRGRPTLDILMRYQGEETEPFA